MWTQLKTLSLSRRSMLTSLLPMLGLGACSGSVSVGYFLDPDAPRYTVEKITVPGTKYPVKGGVLNNKGQVAGISKNLQFFIWTSGQVQKIDFSETVMKGPMEEFSGHYRATVNSITDDGLIAFHYQNDKSQFGSFTYKDGEFNPGQPPWATMNFGVRSVNGRGDAIGWYDPRDRTGKDYSFIYLAGKLSIVKGNAVLFLNDVGQALNARSMQLTDASGVTDIPKPSQGKSVESVESVERVSGLNNLGQFVGSMRVSPSIKGASFVAFIANTKGEYDLLDVGGTESSAIDINDAGVVVGDRSSKFMWGAFSMGYASYNPYVWIKGKAYDLGKASGLYLTTSSPNYSSLKINNRGQILVSVSGEGYLLTPIPSR